MKLTTITCTCDRPEAFALCEKYLARQTIPPHQMIVMDDGQEPARCTLGQRYVYTPHSRGRGSMVAKLHLAIAGGAVSGDAVVIVEDDDWIAPTWLEFCTRELERFDLVGEGKAIYYNVQKRWWYEHNNMEHASLCATAFTKALIPLFVMEAQNTEPFIDSRLWRYPVRKKVFDHAQRLVVGLKALPGKAGYGGGHKPHDPSERPDPELADLRRMIGDDAGSYAGFFQPDAPRPHTPPRNVPAVFPRRHPVPQVPVPRLHPRPRP